MKKICKSAFAFLEKKKRGSDVLAFTCDDTIPFPEKSAFHPSRRWRRYTHVRKHRDRASVRTIWTILRAYTLRDLTRDGQDLDYTPKEQPGYRKYRTVDLPTRSKARELTGLSSSRRLLRPPLLTPREGFRQISG